MPILKSQVRDARPAINAEAESDKKVFSANVAKGFVELRRGKQKGSLLRLKYAEVAELRALVDEVDGLLKSNQYDTNESYSEGYEPGEGRYVPANPTGPRTPAVTADDPTTSNETAQAEGTTPAAQPETVAAQAEFDAEPAQTTNPDPSNPFA